MLVGSHSGYGSWSQKPQILGTWTLWAFVFFGRPIRLTWRLKTRQSSRSLLHFQDGVERFQKQERRLPTSPSRQRLFEPAWSKTCVTVEVPSIEALSSQVPLRVWFFGTRNLRYWVLGFFGKECPSGFCLEVLCRCFNVVLGSRYAASGRLAAISLRSFPEGPGTQHGKCLVPNTIISTTNV